MTGKKMGHPLAAPLSSKISFRQWRCAGGSKCSAPCCSY